MAAGFKIADAYVQVETRYDDDSIVKDFDKTLAGKKEDIKSSGDKHIGTPAAQGASRGFARHVRSDKSWDDAINRKMKRIGRNALPAFFQAFIEAITVGQADFPTGAIAKSPVFGALGTAIAVVLASTIISGLSALLIAGFATIFGAGVIGVAFAAVMDDLEKEIENLQGALAKALEAGDVLIEPFRDAINLLTASVREATPWLRDFFSIFDPVILPLAQGLVGFFEAMGPGLEALGRVAADALLELAEALPGLGQNLSDMFIAIEENWPAIKESVDLFLSDTGNVLQVLGVIFMWMATHYEEMRLMMRILTVPPVLNILIEILQRLSGVVQRTKDRVGESLDTVVQFFTDLPGRVGRAIAGLWPNMWGQVSKANIGMRISALNIVAGFVRTMLTLPGRAMQAIGPIRGRIAGFFSGAGNWLSSAGYRIIGGLVDAIKWAVDNWLKPTLSWVTSMIPAWKGPPEKDATLLYDNGKLIGRSLRDGFMDEGDAFLNELGKFTLGMPGMVPQPRTESGGGGPVNVNVNVDARGASPEAAQKIARETAMAIREALDNLDRSRAR